MSANEVQRRTQTRHGRHWSACLPVLVLLLSSIGCFAKTPVVQDLTCVVPTDSQKESVALLLALATDKRPNGEAFRLGPLDVMPPGGEYAPIPELYGAAEVISRWWGLCWPEGFE